MRAMYFVRDKGAFQYRVVASGRPHTHCVPGLDHPPAVVVARQKGVHDLWSIIGIGKVACSPIRVHTGIRLPNFVASEAEPAIDALGLAGREQHRQVVAALGMAGIQYFAFDCLLQQPFERMVALPPQIGDQPNQ
jgi:hypothetical protein